jgi:hypothetical protein
MAAPAVREAGAWRLGRAGGSAEPGLAWLWLGVVLTWVVTAAVVHALAAVLLGAAGLPFGLDRLVWTIAANGVLLGFLVASGVALRRGVKSDLHALRSALPTSPDEFARLEVELGALNRHLWGAATLLGAVGGIAMATLDPVLRGLHDDLSAADPRYLLFLGQNALVGALAARLIAIEVHMTRGYADLGGRIEVDLFDPSTALIFGRKGLRSVAVWAFVSAAVSMFWLLDSAGQSNVAFPIVMFGVALVALVSPTLGVRRNVARTKAAEQERVGEAIRRARNDRLDGAVRSPGTPPGTLADLVQYDAYLRSIREWPFDFSMVSKSLLFILLGCGSWIGGALAERLLGLLLD